MTKPPSEPLLGIVFTLEGATPATFSALLADLQGDAAFARPLQIQVQPPQNAAPGQLTVAQLSIAQLTIAFEAADRDKALGAMQRLKTLMMRHGLQVDDVRVPQ